MVDSCPSMIEVHDRMPVILRPEAYGQWLGGDPESAMKLCRPYDADLKAERTPELWAGAR